MDLIGAPPLLAGDVGDLGRTCVEALAAPGVRSCLTIAHEPASHARAPRRGVVS